MSIKRKNTDKNGTSKKKKLLEKRIKTNLILLLFCHLLVWSTLTPKINNVFNYFFLSTS